MQECEMFLSANSIYKTPSCVASVDDESIKKVIKNMAVKMRSHHQPGCSYIEAINDFITTHAN